MLTAATVSLLFLLDFVVSARLTQAAPTETQCRRFDMRVECKPEYVALLENYTVLSANYTEVEASLVWVTQGLEQCNSNVATLSSALNGNISYSAEVKANFTRYVDELVHERADLKRCNDDLRRCNLQVRNLNETVTHGETDLSRLREDFVQCTSEFDAHKHNIPRFIGVEDMTRRDAYIGVGGFSLGIFLYFLFSQCFKKSRRSASLAALIREESANLAALIRREEDSSAGEQQLALTRMAELAQEVRNINNRVDTISGVAEMAASIAVNTNRTVDSFKSGSISRTEEKNPTLDGER